MNIYVQQLASTQPRTSLQRFARKALHLTHTYTIRRDLDVAVGVAVQEELVLDGLVEHEHGLAAGVGEVIHDLGSDYIKNYIDSRSTHSKLLISSVGLLKI